jgi:hypothetical protein
MRELIRDKRDRFLSKQQREPILVKGIGSFFLAIFANLYLKDVMLILPAAAGGVCSSFQTRKNYLFEWKN